MTKTLADMTEEERANCPGMWAGTFTGYTGVIVYENGKQAYLMIPEFNREQTFPLDKVTPRFDLPRAWQADGRRPVGEWEYDYVASDGCAMSTGEYVDPKPGEKIRRWIGDWEES